jgi:hypothetical protein
MCREVSGLGEERARLQAKVKIGLGREKGADVKQMGDRVEDFGDDDRAWSVRVSR